MRHLAMTWLLMVAGASSGLAHAQRYQIVSVPEVATRFGQASSTQAKALILDTQEGHLWTWGDSDVLPGTGERRFGSALIYQGRIRPGKQPGEVIEFSPK